MLDKQVNVKSICEIMLICWTSEKEEQQMVNNRNSVYISVIKVLKLLIKK